MRNATGAGVPGCQGARVPGAKVQVLGAWCLVQVLGAKCQVRASGVDVRIPRS
jgi:hypothetical protein